MSSETIVTNPSPKARFLTSKTETQAHRSLMQRADLQRSLDVALMEYQGQLAVRTADKEFNHCAAAHLKMVGALEFINTLKNLDVVSVSTTTRPNDNLDHGVR